MTFYLVFQILIKSFKKVLICKDLHSGIGLFRTCGKASGLFLSFIKQILDRNYPCGYAHSLSLVGTNRSSGHGELNGAAKAQRAAHQEQPAAVGY